MYFPDNTTQTKYPSPVKIRVARMRAMKMDANTDKQESSGGGEPVERRSCRREKKKKGKEKEKK